jgi:hypothetical protein
MSHFRLFFNHRPIETVLPVAAGIAYTLSNAFNSLYWDFSVGTEKP